MRKTYQELLEDIKKFYDEVGPKYPLIYPNIKISNIKIVDSLIKNGLIDTNVYLKIADVACGCGWLLNQIHQSCCLSELYGYDISEKSIDFAKKSIICDDKRISFCVTDWFNIKDHTKEKLDLVLCLGNSLTHFPISIQNKILYSFSELVEVGGSVIVDSYREWNNKLSNHNEIEPKGLTRLEGVEVLSYFISVYSDEIAERNICFATYESKSGNEIKPKTFEHYITYQFPFIINNKKESDGFGFSKVEKIQICDEIDIFEYYKLTK
jgi:ubiquinone/menaquinone biosynthesis C-methylase UbiE